MRAILTLAGIGAASTLFGAAAQAENMQVSVELPRLNVAEYHRPYVAIWIAREDHSVAANLAVWYQLDEGPEGEGETWLKDMRQWWRRIGRSLDMPVDGISSPTRAPGQHTLAFEREDSPLANLPAGSYLLYVEASREVGGREVLSIPFDWQGDSAAEITVSGETELGDVTLTLKP